VTFLPRSKFTWFFSIGRLFAVVALALLPSLDALAATPAWPVSLQNAHAPAAAGGMGNVYKGTDTAAQHYAVKFNNVDANTHAEARVLTAINGHPGWPQFHGTHTFNGAFNNRPANITDWVHGVPLHTFTPRDNPQAVRIVQQLLGHLAQLHALGWIHGDVKPLNVIIDPHVGSRSVMLIDFGIARRVGEGAVHGTPEYEAPEQWSGQAWTAATDTYGAAGVLVHLLTRQDPFAQGRALYNQRAQWNSPQLHALHEERAVLNQIADPALRQVLYQALSPDPAHRFQSAAQFAAALAPFAQ
jgi:serine/threonine protein kinase